MIFKGAELYNVSEMEYNSEKESYDMLRVPKLVEEGLNKDAQKINRFNTGAEIRFVHIDDEIEITMQTEGVSDVSSPMIYYGNIQAGWQDSQKNILGDKTKITVSIPKRLEYLKNIAADFSHPFDPEVVRLIFPCKRCTITDIKGKCTPPPSDKVPQKRILTYGSSITHGSLSILPVNAYAYRVAENLGYDLINLGYAGSAAMEACMADYIAKRKDWDIAHLEMGINVINTMPEDEFANRVSYFIEKIASENPDKKVVCTDMFYFSLDYERSTKVEVYRDIVLKAAEKTHSKNVLYINGKKLLTNMNGVSADLVHPNVRGMEEIARNLTQKIKEFTK